MGGEILLRREEDGVDAYKAGVYPESSVLHGQRRNEFVVHFDSMEEARKVYPDAVEIHKQSLDWETSLTSGMPSEPESWFDPADAGERWDDDY